MTRMAFAALALGVTACAGWHRVEVAPESLPPRQDVQVWTGHDSRTLHGVVITPDSVYGVPFQLPLACDTCRVAFPRARVDSIRLGSEGTNGALWTLGVGAALLFVVVVIVGGFKSNY